MSELWKQRPEWVNMDPRKKIIMEQLLEKSAGKRLNESAGLIMAAINQMKSENLSFSQEETDLLMDSLTRDMSAKDKQKVEMMKRFIKNM